jgi:hypothetical protein
MYGFFLGGISTKRAKYNENQDQGDIAKVLNSKIEEIFIFDE